MDRNLNWQDTTMIALDDRRRIRTPLRRPGDHRVGHMSLEQALTFEQMDEDRRISTAGAFFMFMFGFGCGAFWTIVLSLLF
jgi:hypothetical protein